MKNNVLKRRRLFWITAIVGIGVGALLFVVPVLYNNSNSRACRSFRESRLAALQGSDYDMITRGIAEGMSRDEVQNCVKNSSDFLGTFPAKNIGPGIGEYDEDALVATCRYVFSEWIGIEGFGIRKVFISEQYWIVFDSNGKATVIIYDIYSAGYGLQRIKVNLKAKSISAPLRLQWH